MCDFFEMGAKKIQSHQLLPATPWPLGEHSCEQGSIDPSCSRKKRQHFEPPLPH